MTLPENGIPTTTSSPEPSAPKKPLYKRWWFIAVVVLVFIVIVSQVAGGKDSGSPTAHTRVPTAGAAPSAITTTTPAPKPAEKRGTRANPLPIGTPFTAQDWTVTVNSVTLDATDQMAAENQFNEKAPDGYVYILANITATYTGNDANGSAVTTSVAYVTADGNTINSYDTIAVAPDPFDLMQMVYEGASVTGNVALAVPRDTAAQGVLVISPTMLAEKTFVAVQ